MKTKISLASPRKPLKYKGYLIHRAENSNGYYCTIRKGTGDYGIHVDCTPYRNDIESAVEAAKNSIDFLIRTGRHPIFEGQC